MNLRHVVLKGVDTIRIVVPNSKLNSMKLVNMSYTHNFHSVDLTYNVSYDSDLTLVKKLVDKAVKDCPYTISKAEDGDESERYSGVYFMNFADSSLVVRVLAYFEKTTRPEIVIDDINCRVNDAFRENGVEIPYQYVNVVSK